MQAYIYSDAVARIPETLSAVNVVSQNVDRQCRRAVSAVNAGPCVAGLTEVSHSVYRPILVYGVVTGNCSVLE